jgi:LuxR family maltose regulon positive regulatory protein
MMRKLNQIRPARVIVPNRRLHFLSRPRPLHQLNDLAGYKVVMLLAPVGSGKTSLLLDLAQHSPWPFCWYSLEATDGEISSFISHFIAALGRVFPHFALPARRLWPPAEAEALDLDRVVAGLVDLIDRTIQEHFCLVLDDYHLVQDEPAIDYFVSQFAWRVGPQCHLYFASNRLLNLSILPLLAAHNLAGGIDFEVLAFRPDELQRLMARHYDLTLSAAEALALIQETEGWVTGLLLLAQVKASKLLETFRVAFSLDTGPYDYLLKQYLDKQPPPIRDFLLRTSFFEPFNAAYCAQLLGADPAWPQLIDQIVNQFPFLLSFADLADPWLRYDPIFQKFFQAQLATEAPAEKERILQRLAALT